MQVMRKRDEYCIDRMNPEGAIFPLLDNEELTPGRILLGVVLLQIFQNEFS